MFLLMEHAAFHENPFLKKNKDRQQTLPFEIFLIVKWGKFLLLLLGQWELYLQYFFVALLSKGRRETVRSTEITVTRQMIGLGKHF